MKSYLLIVLSLSLVSLTFAFAPMPTDPALAEKCTSTGGNISETFYAPDCGIGCTAQPETISDCHCPNGIVYKDIKRISNFSGCDNSPCKSDSDCFGDVCANGRCEPRMRENGSSPCAPAMVLLALSSVFFISHSRKA